MNDMTTQLELFAAPLLAVSAEFYRACDARDTIPGYGADWWAAQQSVDAISARLHVLEGCVRCWWDVVPSRQEFAALGVAA